MTIFVDASGAVSYFDINDSNHSKALYISNKFGKNKIITSNYVYAEIVTIVSQNAGKEVAINAGNSIKKNFSVIRITTEIENLAWEIFKKQTSKNISFVDYFGLDHLAGISVDNSPRYEGKVIEETEEYQIYTTSWGATLKNWKHIGSIKK